MSEEFEGVDGWQQRLQESGTLWAAQLLQRRSLHFPHPLLQSCDILDRSLRGALLVGELRDCALQIARLLRKLLIADILSLIHISEPTRPRLI
eukprot:4791259-Amphidinium_carterae.1